MPDPRVPKFRVPAAFVSPAALCLVGGLCYFFTLDFSSEDELNSNIKKEFPQVKEQGWGRAVRAAGVLHDPSMPIDLCYILFFCIAYNMPQ